MDGFSDLIAVGKSPHLPAEAQNMTNSAHMTDCLKLSAQQQLLTHTHFTFAVTLNFLILRPSLSYAAAQAMQLDVSS